MFIQFFCQMSLIIQARTQKSPLIRHYFAFIETIPTLMIWCDYSKRSNVTGKRHLNYIFSNFYESLCNCMYLRLDTIIDSRIEWRVYVREGERLLFKTCAMRFQMLSIWKKKSFSYWFACTMNSVYKLTMPIKIDLFHSRPIKATDSSIYSVCRFA